MKLRVLAGSVGAVALIGTAQAATEVSHVKVNETFVSAVNGDATKSGLVQAFRAEDPGPNGTVQYFVQYRIQQCDGGFPINTCDGAQGFGMVPPSTVQANATTARLNVNTSAVGSFTNTVFHLVFDFSGGDPVVTETSAPGPGGVIDMSWRANGASGFKNTGQTETRAGAFTFRTTGTQEGNVATAQGSIVGVPFTAPFADLGVTHHTIATIIRN